VGHRVQSLGVPPTEIGGLLLDGREVPAEQRVVAGGTLEVSGPTAPQPTPTDPPRFLLDVHLGSLARRLRLLGLDTAYDNHADDPELVLWSLRERRVLLTRDRGLLRRSALRWGAYVYSDRADQQAGEVLARFSPTVRPWTRCTACNGDLEPVEKASVLDRLEPGTARSYQHFVRCTGCDRVFWHGAHAERLHTLVHSLADAAPDGT